MTFSLTPENLRRAPPRYDLLAQALLNDIREGRIKIGELLPSEAMLQERYNVSRHTVRQALRELRGKGVIVSRAGVGTIVRSEGIAPRFVHASSSIEDLLNFSRETILRVVDSEQVVSSDGLAQIIGCKPGQAWQKITVLRLRNDNDPPLGLLTIFLRPELAGVESLINGSKKTIFTLLEEQYGIRVSEIRQQISSVLLDTAQKAVFSNKESHGLQIVRHYHDAQGQLIETSVGIYPGSAFSFQSTLRANDQ